MFDPLDAPEIQEKARIYSPQRIRQFIGVVVVLMPFNLVGHTWWMKINWTAENLWIMFMIQLLMGLLMAFIVGIYAFFKQEHIPYFSRAGQWFLASFTAFQLLYTIGLVSKFIGLT